MRPADGYEPLHRDGQGHVGGRAEGHGGHGVENVDIHLGQELGVREPGPYKLKSGTGMDRDIEEDKPEQEFALSLELNLHNFLTLSLTQPGQIGAC
jgi:hypothetical protein